MDRAAKARLIEDVRRQHGVVLDAATFTLCEKAAGDIVANMRHRNKVVFGRDRNGSLVPGVEFYSRLVSDAARTIANENGANRAGIGLPIAILVIAAIVFVLYKYHYTDFAGVLSMWESIKNFGVTEF